MSPTTGPNVSIDASQGSSTESSSTVATRKRRKVIKSCAFCRKRKLRCDQQKPMCSTCIARRLPECLYTNSFDHDLDTSELFGSLPNVKLLRKLNELEKQLEKTEVSPLSSEICPESTMPHKKPTSKALYATKSTVYHITDDNSFPDDVLIPPSPKNPLETFYTFQCKDTGRRIYYGPTSMKTFVAKGNWGLLERFRLLWAKVKIARRKVKQANGFSMLRELSMIEVGHQPSHASSCALLDRVCRALPSYEKAKSAIDLFFGDADIYEINTIFDKRKILNDFQLAFIPGDPSAGDNERPIVKLCPTGKKNYYKIGVLVNIITFSCYHDNIPEAIEMFLIFLTGLSTAKVMYIERAQFLMLRYHHRIKYSHTGGDNSHVMLLVDSMISTATYLGLDHNIGSLYADQEEVVGNVQSLENLWVWIMFADFDVAFQMGRPLRVTVPNFNDDIDRTNTFYGLLKRFLKMSRPMISEIYNPTSPNLKQHCETIIEFIEKEFPPMGCYTDITLIGEIPLRNVRILCQALSMLVAFYCLRYLAFKEANIGLKNGLIQCTLISFFLSSNLTIHCFELDRKNFPDMLKPECSNITPYLSYSISLMSGLVSRGLMAFYAVAYHKMTLFESGLLFAFDKQETLNCDLKSLRPSESAHISFISSFELFCQTFDRVSNPEDVVFKMVMRRSHAFVIVTAIEKICRTVMEKVFECRTNAESLWISGSQQTHLSDLDAIGKSVTPQLRKDSVGADDALVDQKHTIGNTNIPDGNGNPVSTEQESDMVQMISDDFWESYNLGWQQLLDSTDSGNVFSDMML